MYRRGRRSAPRADWFNARHHPHVSTELPLLGHREALVGSVTPSLAADAPCAGPGDPDCGSSEASKRCADRALARAADLSQALGRELIVVSVGPPTPVVAVPEMMVASSMPIATAPGAFATRPASDLAADEPDDATLLLGQARRLLTSRPIEADFVAEHGDPVEKLLDVADARNADLIVVGCHQHGFLHRLLGHGVDEELARRAHCDVLLVH
jgi:nucleotide-binding universal stress UspA family protein